MSSNDPDRPDSTILNCLGRIIYEEQCHSEPWADDVPWPDLDEDTVQGYESLAEMVVRNYEVMVGLPAAELVLPLHHK